MFEAWRGALVAQGEGAGPLAGIDQKWLIYAAIAAGVWWLLRQPQSNPTLDQLSKLLRSLLGGLLNWPQSGGGDLDAEGVDGIATRVAAAASLSKWLRKNGYEADAKRVEATIPKLGGK